MILTCQKCGARVQSPENRACGHNDAPAVASLQATCYGEGGAAIKKPNVLESMIRGFIKAIGKVKQ